VRRVPVESRAIASVGYDPAGNVLELEFVEGDVYQYFLVPASVHRELMAADSLGNFFRLNVRDRYEYRRL
jgi:hypothetical protein